MRAETDVAEVPVGAPWVAPPRAPQRRRRPIPDWFELLVLAAFAASSLWILALDLWQAHVHRLVWTGTDGFYITDQAQYLAWIEAAAKHVLASNLFVLHSTAADYFQPAVTISGGLAALGVPVWLTLMLWKPVAVLAMFYAVRAYAHRSLEGIWARRLAILLALFFGSLTVAYGSVGILGDLYPAFLSWGYAFALLAIAVMLFALLAYERARSETGAGSRWILWAPALLGALASLLHPWNGELLIVMVVGAEVIFWALDRKAPRRMMLPAITVIATGVPLLYYAILTRADISWTLAVQSGKHSFPASAIFIEIVPLLVPALLAYWVRPTSFLPVATRIWPLAALLTYGLSGTALAAAPLHAFEGITVPLAILAIEGVQRTGLTTRPVSRRIVPAAVIAVTVPGTVVELAVAKTTTVPAKGNATFITHDERAALRYLAKDRQRGGVFTRLYLGEVVPAITGRRTFVGTCIWSEPNCGPRQQMANMVFDGTLPPDIARWFVQRIGARFVLADCHARPDIDDVLAPLTASMRHFGCATVYTLRSVGQPPADLAESPPHAPLRAPGRQQRRVQYA